MVWQRNTICEPVNRMNEMVIPWYKLVPPAAPDPDGEDVPRGPGRQSGLGHYRLRHSLQHPPIPGNHQPWSTPHRPKYRLHIHSDLQNVDVLRPIRRRSTHDTAGNLVATFSRSMQGRIWRGWPGGHVPPQIVGPSIQKKWPRTWKK